MERRNPGPIDRLTSVRDWRTRRLGAVGTLAPGMPTLRVRDVAWPARATTGMRRLGAISVDSVSADVVWSIAVGPGQLVVSGALDAWVYRDGPTGDFDRYWTRIIAELSAGTPRAVDVSLTRRVVRPGDETTVRVSVGEAAFSPAGAAGATVTAWLRGSRDSTMIRLWPDGAPGRFTALVTAPRTPGSHEIVVSSGAQSTAVPLLVDPSVGADAPDDSRVTAAFVESRGGRALDARDVPSLPGILSAAFRPLPRVETWHPMRSPWWIVPFALALGAEWWWRRRRGLA
jgi:hypothetical protein